MKRVKRAIAILLIMILVLLMSVPMHPIQAEGNEDIIIDVSKSNAELEALASASGGRISFEEKSTYVGVITIHSGNVTLTGHMEVATVTSEQNCRQFIFDDGYIGTVTLDSVQLPKPNGKIGEVMKLGASTEITLVIKGDNLLYAGGGSIATIGVPLTAKLIIENGETTGIGKLNLNNQSGGAIGDKVACGTVIINGGRLVAKSTGFGSPIGGSTTNATGGNITINDGIVIAKDEGGKSAGIGGGCNGNGGTLTINGGYVEVAAYASGKSRDIGGGETGEDGTLTINGGNIYLVNGRYPTGNSTRNAAGEQVYPVTVPATHTAYGTNLKQGLTITAGSYIAKTKTANNEIGCSNAIIWLPAGEYNNISVGSFGNGKATVTTGATTLSWDAYNITKTDTASVNGSTTISYGDITNITKGATGDTITISAVPNANFKLVSDNLKVTSSSYPNGISLTNVSEGVYSFTMPTENINIQASYVMESVTSITPSDGIMTYAGGNNTITLSGQGMEAGYTVQAFIDGNAIDTIKGTTTGTSSTQIATLIFPANTTGNDIEYTIKYSKDGSTFSSDTVTVMIPKNEYVSSIATNSNIMTHAGGNNTITLSGQYMEAGYTVQAFIGGNAIDTIKGTTTGTSSTQIATLIFPANTTGSDIEYTIKYSKDGSTFSSDTVTVKILHESLYPTITKNLETYIVMPYTQNTKILTVEATGEHALQYQWYKDGKMVENQTSNSICIDKSAIIHSYYVVVKDSVSGYSVNSNVCTVKWSNENVGAVEVTNEVIDNVISVTIDNENEILAAVLTDEDRALLATTDSDIRISLLVREMNSVESEDCRLTEETLVDNQSIAMYLDLSMIKRIIDATTGTTTETNITYLSEKVRIQLSLSENLRVDGREYQVIRIHEGVATVLPDLDESIDTVTIETDRFSTYALVYTEKAESTSKNTNGKGVATGDVTPISIFIEIIVLSGLGLVIIYNTKQKSKIND